MWIKPLLPILFNWWSWEFWKLTTLMVNRDASIMDISWFSVAYQCLQNAIAFYFYHWAGMRNPCFICETYFSSDILNQGCCQRIFLLCLWLFFIPAAVRNLSCHFWKIVEAYFISFFYCIINYYRSEGLSKATMYTKQSKGFSLSLQLKIELCGSERVCLSRDVINFNMLPCKI